MKGLIKKGNVNVLRTREGSIFEIAGGTLVLGLWALVLGTGPANIITGITGTFVTGFALACAYHPDTMVSVPVTVRSAEGWTWVTRMVRVLALELAQLFMAVVIDGERFEVPILTMLASVVLVATLVVFCVIIARKR